MGQCCDSKQAYTDNDAENVIIEAYSSLKIHFLDLEDFDFEFRKQVKISLLDIDDNKWYDDEIYDSVVDNLIINSSVDKDNTTEQKLCLVKFDSKSKDMHFQFLLNILPVFKHNLTEQISIIYGVVQSYYKVVNFDCFAKFLNRYLFINLICVTENFALSSKIYNDSVIKGQYHNLISKIFNRDNYDDFSNELLNSMKKILMKSNPLLKANNLSLEFIRKPHFKIFFERNNHLIGIVELRNFFFNKYCYKSTIVD